MTDSLDNLTDHQLAEIAAVEIAGWEWWSSATETWLASPHIVYSPEAGFTKGKREGVQVIQTYWLPWVTCADSVVPLLDRFTLVDAIRLAGRGWHVAISPGTVCHADGQAPTFARAACLALIRSVRARKHHPALQ
jgi:hypothetical protein